jgi:hypothetical protein
MYITLCGFTSQGQPAMIKQNFDAQTSTATMCEAGFNSLGATDQCIGLHFSGAN